MEVGREETEESGKGTWKHAAFHVATTIATPAAYAPLPFALASLGWPLGVTSLVSATLATWYSSFLIASLWKWNGEKYLTYRHLAHSIFGFWGYWSIAFFQQVASLGNNIAIQIAAGSSLKIYCRPTYACFEETRGSKSNKSTSHFPFPLRNRPAQLIFTSIFMVLVTLIAAAMPFFGDFVSICGAIGFTPLDFVFPVLAYLKAGRTANNSKLGLLMRPLNILIATWFSIVAILGCIGAVRFIMADIKNYNFFHDM
eukprot:XP_025981280.1 GABA transporter 1-like [Glycine max]